MKKRIIISVIAVLTLVCMLTACGTSSGGNTTKPTDAPSVTDEPKAPVTDAPTEEPTAADTVEYKGMTVKFIEHKIGKSKTDKDELVVYLEFTNNADESKAYSFNFNCKAFQNGIEMDTSYLSSAEESGNGLKEIKPGATLTVAEAFELTEDRSDVELEIGPLFDLTGKDKITINLKLQ